jgi:hypothetical protein
MCTIENALKYQCIHLSFNFVPQIKQFTTILILPIFSNDFKEKNYMEY